VTKARVAKDMSPAELAEWDAEIEAEFQRVVTATTKRPGKRERKRRHFGGPWEFIAHVCRLTRGRSALVVALYVYHRTVVCRTQTVELIGAELAELGVTKSCRHWALQRLQDVGVVRLNWEAASQRLKVSLLWRPSCG
jgi:hypothetical protein